MITGSVQAPAGQPRHLASPGDQEQHLALQMVRAEIASRGAMECADVALNAVRNAVSQGPVALPLRDVLADLERIHTSLVSTHRALVEVQEGRRTL